MKLRWPAWLMSICAARRRRAGYYDRDTLAAYAAAWRYSRKPDALIRYVLFRRDLGWKLPVRWVEPMLHMAPRLGERTRGVMLSLVAEVSPDSLNDVPVKWLHAASGHFPGIAGTGAYGESETSNLIGLLHSRQSGWRMQFRDWLLAHREQGVCVVGNAASLRGASLGIRIDKAGIVARFNQFQGGDSSVSDTGTKTNVWIVSPGFRGTCPAGVDWTIVTGPDMRFRLQNWKMVLPVLEAGRPVLTVPLSIWRMLVSKFHAPPSAGVLTLAWFHSLLGNWNGVTSVGVGSGLTKQGLYHAVDPFQRAGRRHNWDMEKDLVQVWKSEGLGDFDASG